MRGLSVILLAIACSSAVIEACQTEDAGCAGHLPCCSGLKCNNGAETFGFCKKAGGAAPSPTAGKQTTAATRPAQKPTTPKAPATNSQGSSSKNLVTKDQFFKAVTSNGFPQPTDAQYDHFVKGAPNGHITTKRELAMFLANIIHESGGLKKIKEEHPLPEYGKYYGRGYIQLSWDYNYKAASAALYHDDRLLTNPDLILKDDQVAWDTSFWFWGDNVHAKDGVQQGHFGASIKAINGWHECNGENLDQSKARYQYYKRILAIFVPGETPIETGCYN
ncbi:uncharacterized protein LOC129597315 [Paramacrobiotus metropolitanus]|uniref:uncharacterized protein LOC129597315 n=1 Tax=Paramacrobiotus metropolitanus TaxID=2943436 RepID=UPI002445D6DA|nr:uncharacterized protein LOC129597315 [Paramacrobiotus metropolitanus]